MGEQLRGGELVVKVLEEFGARAVFGVPGGQTLFVTDPLLDTPIRFIHTRHENGAACAADGWGRMTGEPGICLACLLYTSILNEGCCFFSTDSFFLILPFP